MIERYHPSDQNQLQDFSVVIISILHRVWNSEIAQPRKFVWDSILFDYYRRDLQKMFKKKVVESS